MQYAIISDVHANTEALMLALKDIKKRGISRIFCLGDVVGYGWQPEETITQLRKNNIITVMGNHDEAIVDPDYLTFLNEEAREAIIRHKNKVSDEHLAYLAQLPKSYATNEFHLAHGLPPDDNWSYLHTLFEDDIRRLFEQFDKRIAFVGHTHLFAYNELRSGGELIIHQTLTAHMPMNPDSRYIINCGTIGKGRFPDYEQGYVVYNENKNTVEKVILS